MKISDCCAAPVRVGGEGLTHWYVCTKCSKPCEGEDLDNAITAAVYDWINDYVSIELTYLKYDAPEEINGT